MKYIMGLVLSLMFIQQAKAQKIITYRGTYWLLETAFMDDELVYPLVSVSVGFRPILFNITNNSSIGLHVAPKVGALSFLDPAYDTYGLMDFSVPFMVEYNFGAIATTKTLRQSGVGLAFGAQYYFGPIFSLDPLEGHTNAIMGVSRISWRGRRDYTNSESNTKYSEVFFQTAIGQKQTWYPNMHFLIGFNKYLNY